ncbi:putative DNA-binding domain-containing protein [Vibrio pectenicida]|uniref:DUF2063 domain-containing protein n=1 Tax=Vibrio pectenicida TaxID=62763 RepID=A0A3R9FQT1_9VIBR|nr:putative DNA-binding domain-containing protein [Vibrio pectenicida]RSD32214.1 DUF2063 domain-containing protein [Vibrio pectenicida]
MLNPPNQMQTQTESLSAMIRFPNEKNILCRYSEFIRDNVLSVVNATFPLFYAQFSRQKLDGMVDGFVTKHGAFEAEFHQIATEFVHFLQKDKSNSTNFVSSQQLALLEYEWVTFCVEIDSISGKMSYFTPKEVVEDDCLQVNPTLKLTQVPFLLHQDSVTFLTSDSHFVFYGVFRNQDHHVVSQRLRDVDVALIQMLIDQPDLTSAQLQQTVNQNDVSFSVIEWVQHFGELGLLKVQFIGE